VRRAVPRPRIERRASFADPADSVDELGDVEDPVLEEADHAARPSASNSVA
jgi:hypothetical protein